MIKGKYNGYARWIIVIIAVGGIIFNTAVLYNDVKHLKTSIQEVKQEIRDLRNFFLRGKE